MTKETKNVMEDLIHHSKRLENQNEKQSARLKMFDDMMLLFRSSPSHGVVAMHQCPIQLAEAHILCEGDQNES